jgi:hypothetical protein
MWLLARSKVPYYGSFPAGFLQRARDLLGVGLDDAVLHVCAGRVRDYPFRGLGLNDMTVDIDPACNPDFCKDVRNGLPGQPSTDYGPWDAVLIDRPYSEADADHYATGRTTLPNIQKLLSDSISVVHVGGKVGVLDYVAPRPPKNARLVALVGVVVGFNNRIRVYSVFERTR